MTSLFKGTLEAMRLAVPLMLAQMGIVAMGMADTYTFGQLGTEALAGGSLAMASFFMIHIFCFGVLMGISNLVAYAFGANDHAGLARAVKAGLAVALGLSVIGGLAVFFFPLMLKVMQQSEQAVRFAGYYLHVAAFSMLPSFLYIALRSLAVGLSRPGPIFVITSFALVAKLLMNWAIIVYGRTLVGEERAAFGLMACAAGTVFINIGTLIALYLWCKKYLSFAIEALWHTPFSRHGIGELLKLGLPIGITIGVESGLFSGTAFIIGWSGEVALAAHQIALQFASLTFMLAAGLANSSSARVGHAAGAGDFAEARRLGFQAIVLGLMIITAPMLIFIVYGGALADLLVAEDAAHRREVLSLATHLLLFAAAFQWADATQTIAMGALRGLKFARTTMIVCSLGYWGVGLPLVYLLHRFYGPTGAWTGLTLSLYLTAGLLVERFYSKSKV